MSNLIDRKALDQEIDLKLSHLFYGPGDKTVPDLIAYGLSKACKLINSAPTVVSDKDGTDLIDRKALEQKIKQELKSEPRNTEVSQFVADGLNKALDLVHIAPTIVLNEETEQKKVYYCSHRGLLEESLKTQKSFSSTKEAITHVIEDIVENLCYPSINESNLYIQYYLYDEHIESDIFLISIGSIGKEDYIKKYGCPQAYGWLRFKSEWKDKILEWKKIHEDKYIQAEFFVEFFDGHQNKESITHHL